MKKIMIVTLLSVFGFSHSGSAQDINYGAKVGLNIANVSGDGSGRTDMVNFHAGFITEFIFRRGLFGLQPELLFSRQGLKRGSSYRNNLDYISVPLMFKFFPAKVFSLDIGPQASFLINDTAQFVGDPDSKIDTGAENFDLGLNIGVGMDFKNNLFGHARYNLGVSKVYGDLNNSVLQFSMGYKF
ncbi:outer membrane protein with beta-barrel domain [Gelidibacter sediminis]|uniref:Outer membrane protein with beta-barrel domain n=1 Tax=Gelidibacter sediminis TaxID=1608710 RepID=A0A4R7Q8M6_9FLAO|nr:porin family protein [Gelidibacter sediminis]TDU43151.1 outer membrane protein with beta-barrel domain [Gelidibacter sediminis]